MTSQKTAAEETTPTIENEDLGQTSNWSKLVAAYLPVARLTILDRLVLIILTTNIKEIVDSYSEAYAMNATDK